MRQLHAIAAALALAAPAAAQDLAIYDEALGIADEYYEANANGTPS